MTCLSHRAFCENEMCSETGVGRRREPALLHAHPAGTETRAVCRALAVTAQNILSRRGVRNHLTTCPWSKNTALPSPQRNCRDFFYASLARNITPRFTEPSPKALALSGWKFNAENSGRYQPRGRPSVRLWAYMGAARQFRTGARVFVAQRPSSNVTTPWDSARPLGTATCLIPRMACAVCKVPPGRF